MPVLLYSIIIIKGSVRNADKMVAWEFCLQDGDQSAKQLVVSHAKNKNNLN